jgi:hypothetical protein
MPSSSPLLRSLVCRACPFRAGGCGTCPLSAGGRRLWALWGPPVAFAAGLLGAAGWLLALWLGA